MMTAVKHSIVSVLLILFYVLNICTGQGPDSLDLQLGTESTVVFTAGDLGIVRKYLASNLTIDANQISGLRTQGKSIYLHLVKGAKPITGVLSTAQKLIGQKKWVIKTSNGLEYSIINASLPSTVPSVEEVTVNTATVPYVASVDQEMVNTYQSFSQRLQEEIDRRGMRWKTKVPTAFSDYDKYTIKTLAGAKPGKPRNSAPSEATLKTESARGKDNSRRRRPRPARQVDEDVPPANYWDWRDSAPSCPSIGLIRQQGDCAACWAVASASSISDRYCIYTNKTRYFSAMQLVSCAMPIPGCAGGFPEDAMSYYVTYGLVSGGRQLSGEDPGCLSYPPWFATNSANRKNLNDKGEVVAPVCRLTCDSSSRNFTEDLIKGYAWEQLENTTAFNLEAQVIRIQNQIQCCGPVVARLTVYEDFMVYDDGIYELVDNFPNNTVVGDHAVKLIGWGHDDESNLDYWLCANSWGPSWGDKGFFKIRQGVNMVGIETFVTYAFPLQAEPGPQPGQVFQDFTAEPTTAPPGEANAQPGAETQSPLEATAAQPGAEAPSTLETTSASPGAEAPSTLETTPAPPGAEAPSTLETTSASPGAEAPSTLETTPAQPGGEAPSTPTPETTLLPTPAAPGEST